MQTLSCQNPVLNLRLPPCATDPTKALLNRNRCTPIEVALSIDAETRQVTLGPLPSTIARGVWMLQIITPCGCYHAPVWMENCTPPAFPGEHLDTPAQGTIPVCCPNEPDLCAGGGGG